MEDDKGISLLSIIIETKFFFEELKKNWIRIAIIVFSFSIVGSTLAIFSKPQYIATTTMMLENSKSSGISGAVALASQIGLVGGGGGNSEMNGGKLLEIIKAETVVKAAFFEKATIGESSDFLANHFLNLFDYRKKNSRTSSLNDFRFVHNKDNLTLEENAVFKMLYGQIISNFLKSDNSKNGIISISITSSSELFSKYFNEFLVRAVNSFYIDHVTEKEKNNVNVVQQRVDSIANALASAEYALARWKDGSNQLVKAQGMITEMRLRRDLEVCNSIYLEGIKQLEISKFTLLDETPFLQIIDHPFLPLSLKSRFTLIQGIVGGAVVGFFVAALFVFAKKKYLEAIAQIEKH